MSQMHHLGNLSYTCVILMFNVRGVYSTSEKVVGLVYVSCQVNSKETKCNQTLLHKDSTHGG